MAQRCVLIVDDDAGIRCLLVAYLRRGGFRLCEARNGREALAQMRGGAVDLVVMDLMMPEVNGWDVLRERAAEPSLRRIPVIVITANNVRDVAHGLAGWCIAAILPKPFDLETLMTTITATIGRPPFCAPVAA